jgi:hypothetical protein
MTRETWLSLLEGLPSAVILRLTAGGNTSRSCESPTQTIRKLHDQAGIEGAGATSTQRMFAVRLKRRGYDLRHVREVLGLAGLAATKELVGGDPDELGRILARIIWLGARRCEKAISSSAESRLATLQRKCRICHVS